MPSQGGGCVARWQLHAVGADAHGGGQGRLPTLAATSDTDSVNHLPLVSLHTNLLNVHLYTILNWVFRLMHARPGMHLFQAKVLLLLISCQYRGVEAAFGPTAWRDESNRERLRGVLREMDGIAVVPEDGVGGGSGGLGVELSRDKVLALLGMDASGRAAGLVHDVRAGPVEGGVIAHPAHVHNPIAAVQVQQGHAPHPEAGPWRLRLRLRLPCCPWGKAVG